MYRIFIGKDYIKIRTDEMIKDDELHIKTLLYNGNIKFISEDSYILLLGSSAQCFKALFILTGYYDFIIY